jgi:hypothetical protein
MWSWRGWGERKVKLLMMKNGFEIKSLRGIGKLYSIKLTKEQEQSNYSSFRKELAIAMINVITQYTELIKKLTVGKRSSDTYIWYSERSMTATYINAFNKMQVPCISEYPVKRDKKDRRIVHQKDNGRVDYWAYYNHQDYFIEVKHFTHSIKTPSLKVKENAYGQDHEKLRNTNNYSQIDKLNRNRKPKLLLIQTFATYVNEIDYAFPLESKTKMIQKQLNYITKNQTLNFDEIIIFEWNEKLTKLCWTEYNQKKQYWPILFICYKRVSEK